MIKVHLRELLTERNMTMAQLSYLTHINKNTISDISHGRLKGIRLTTLDKICGCLGCSVGEVLEFVSDR